MNDLMIKAEWQEPKNIIYGSDYVHSWCLSFILHLFVLLSSSQFLLSRVLFINFLRWKNHQESRMLCLGGATAGVLLLFLHLHFYGEQS